MGFTLQRLTIIISASKKNTPSAQRPRSVTLRGSVRLELGEEWTRRKDSFIAGRRIGYLGFCVNTDRCNWWLKGVVDFGQRLAYNALKHMRKRANPSKGGGAKPRVYS
jgi:hypothetical protein